MAGKRVQRPTINLNINGERINLAIREGVREELKKFCDDRSFVQTEIASRLLLWFVKDCPEILQLHIAGVTKGSARAALSKALRETADQIEGQSGKTP